LKPLEDVVKDLRDMKVKRRRQKAEDREEWAPVIIKETKTFRRPYSKEVLESLALY
jgi:hypothetical protein